VQWEAGAERATRRQLARFAALGTARWSRRFADGCPTTSRPTRWDSSLSLRSPLV